MPLNYQDKDSFIPRWVSSKRTASTQLHGFCDASHAAYGACLYARVLSSDGSASSKLLISKTGVAPLKSLTIPRSELCAAVLLANLLHKVNTAMDMNFIDTFLWSDPTVALAWLKSRTSNLQVLVANRVATIQSLTSNCSWRYLHSKNNPAHILSRGLSPNELVLSKLWFCDPEWLETSEETWPIDITSQSPFPVEQLPETKCKTSQVF